MAAGFTDLLKENRNYRYTWMGQIVSEIGDHFNNIAVFSLALATTHSGFVISGIMLARAVPAITAGPLAGVLLDRMDRKRIMMISDLVRAVIAALFIITVSHPSAWLLYLLSGLLMFASPFFTAGRASILPTIASKDELHAANSLTQTTQWANITLGTFLGGAAVAQFGYEWAFVLNAFSFVFSAFCISRLRVPGDGFRAKRASLTESDVMKPWKDYKEGLSYMKRTPLVLGIALVSVGWATGGGAAQILFSLFGEIVFKRGAGGIGTIWGFAGIGLLIGGAIGHWWGKRASFKGYKRTIVIVYLIHGSAYVLFSQMEAFWLALLFIALSRAAVAISSVLNYEQLLRHVPDEFRGRVFATNETMTWAMMMISMMAAGAASLTWSPRVIGAWSGVLSSTTALLWGWLNWRGRLPEPATKGVDPREFELHGDLKL